MKKRKLLNILLILPYIVVFAIIVLEVAYRYQVVDTYQPELKAFNSNEQLTKKEKTILVIGDSFSAGKDAWVSYLQKELTDYRVINSAVSGTGPVQQAYIAEKRISQYSPDILIWQLYAGNDLWDVYKTANWNTVDKKRNIYWTLSNYLRSLGYINYRIGQQFHDQVLSHKELGGDTLPFSVERYTERQKIMLAAEPALIQNQLLLENGREKQFIEMMVDIKKVVASCKHETKIVLLVVPHCAQVNQQYLDNMKALGGTFTNEEAVLKSRYSLLTSIEANFRSDENTLVLSLLDEFKEEENEYEDPVYYQNDPHLNPDGQEVMADFVLRECEELF